MLTVAEMEKYLARIGYDGGVTCSLQNLSKLMLCHLLSIPFETVGMHRQGQAPSLAHGDLYDKIILEGKGGYCFELNKLFQLLLDSLGYKTEACFARSIDVPGQESPIDHRGLIVELQGKRYLTDVGWGGPMAAGPLLLEDRGIQEVEGQQFLVTPLDEAWWRIERMKPSDGEGGALEAFGIMELCMAATKEADFEVLNAHCSRPGSEFRDNELVNMRTRTGHVSLTNRQLTIRSNGEKRTYELEDRSAVDAALKKHFHLEYR